jgi:hypothetical protein
MNTRTSPCAGISNAFFKTTERWHLTAAEQRALPREVALWFRMLKAVPPFSGRTPLALLFRGTPGFKAVAQYLAEWAKQGTKI